MVKSIFQNGKDFLFQEQKTILSAAAVISFMILTASLLGLIKMRLYAGVLGAGSLFDVFTAAFKIPDFVFQLIVAGSLNAAFIPLFSNLIAKEDAKAAWGFASNVFNIICLFFAALSVIIFFFAQQLSLLVAAGFNSEQSQTLVVLMRILSLSPLFLGLSNFISGALQSFKRFFLPFLSPIVYNLGAIFGILFLYQPLGLKGLAWGIVLGSFLHLLIQLPLLFHLGFRYVWRLSFKDSLTKKLFSLSFLRSLSLGAEQFKDLLLINFASFLPTGAISVFRFGQSIALVPVSAIGVAIAQASLPTLSQEAETDLNRFKQTLLTSFHEILYLILPLSTILIVLKVPVVRLILGIGKFDWNATILTAWVLAILAFGLFAQSLSHLLIRAFYALHDTKTPLFASLASVILTILLALTFVFVPGLKSWGIKGLALSLTLGSLLEMIWLIFKISDKAKIKKSEIILPSLPIIFSSFVLALTVYIPVKILDQVFLDTTRTVNLIILVWLVLALGLTTYLLLTWLLGCKEIRIFFKILLKLKNLRETFLSFKKLPIVLE